MPQPEVGACVGTEDQRMQAAWRLERPKAIAHLKSGADEVLAKVGDLDGVAALARGEGFHWGCLCHG